jgi:hypothetical protein
MEEGRQGNGDLEEESIAAAAGMGVCDVWVCSEEEVGIQVLLRSTF